MICLFLSTFREQFYNVLGAGYQQCIQSDLKAFSKTLHIMLEKSAVNKEILKLLHYSNHI